MVKFSAVAACLLAAVAVGRYGLPPTAPEPDGRKNDQWAGLRFTVDEISNDAAIFQQIAEVYDQRTAWVLLSDRVSEFGLGADPDATASRLLLVRLILSSKDRVLSSADLLIVPGHAVQATMHLAGGQSLDYHVATTSGEQSRLSLWVEINEDKRLVDSPAAALATAIPIEPGRLFKAGEVSTPMGDYEIRVAMAEALRVGA